MTSVRDAIFQVTPDPDVRRAMLMGSWLEGGWSAPFPAGDHGTSLGPFQIHLPAHPDASAGLANDPVAAARYMLPEYQAGVRRAGGAGTAQQAATAAYYAERPAQMYPASRYQSAWSQVQAAMDGSAQGGDGGGDPISTALGLLAGSMDPLSGIVDVIGKLIGVFSPIGKFFDALAWLVNPMNWLRILLGIFAAALFVGAVFMIGTAV